MITEIKIGSQVICTSGSIDEKIGEGDAGRVEGFARFSSYHPREASVSIKGKGTFWFWLSDLEMDYSPVNPSCAEDCIF